jgi:hypothetical protein
LNAKHRRGTGRRRRSLIERNRTAIFSITAVATIGALIFIAVLQAGGDNTSSPPAAPGVQADPAVVSAITSLAPSLMDAVGKGSAANPPARTSSTGGATGSGPQTKPYLLFVGGEFCPFCASERWPLIIALSRFGKFEGLTETRSAAADVHPNTASLSFFGSTYESPYLTFEAVELYSNERSGSGYAPLETLSTDQSAIYTRFNPGGGIPFFYIDGLYVMQGANYGPDTLAGLDWAQIAAAIQQPDSKVSKAIVGSANLLTAAICKTTGGQPGEVCDAAGVQQASGMLP